VAGKAALNNILAVFRRRIEHKLGIGEVDQFGIVKPGRDQGGGQAFLQQTNHLRPDIRV
jgi:hypothetical protein